MDPLHASQSDLSKGLAEKFKNVQFGTPEEQMMQPPPPVIGEGATQNQGTQQQNQQGQQQQNGNQSADNNSSLSGATDANKAGEQKKEEVKVPTFEEQLTERSGGKFKAWEDLQSVLDAPKTEFSNETVKKLNDFAKEIGDENLAFELFVEHQRNDYDQMDYPELLVMKLAIENPMLDDDAIEALYMAKYNIHKWAKEDEEQTPEEKGWRAMLVADAEKARADLKAQREKVFLENKKPDPTEVAKREAQLHQQWTKASDTALKGFDKYQIPVSDGDGKELEKFDIAITPEMSAAVQKFSHTAGKDFTEAIAPFVLNDKGEVDHRKVHEVGFILQNYQSLIKAASRQGYALGAKGIVANLKNANMQTENSNMPKPVTQDQATQQAIAKGLREAGLV